MVLRATDPAVTLRMKLVKSKGTKLEKQLHERLKREKVSFKYQEIISGIKYKPDFILKKYRIAILVNGCFWHVCPRHCSWPKTNADWWRAKLLANVKRDRKIDRILRQNGWSVVHIWEHEKLDHAMTRVRCMIRRKCDPVFGW